MTTARRLRKTCFGSWALVGSALVTTALFGACTERAEASASTQKCPGPAGASITASLSIAKDIIGIEHYADAKRRALQIKALASICITKGVDVDEYHYVRAYALMEEAQARLGLGDITGVKALVEGANEANALANKPDAEQQLRLVAANMVDGARYELNAIQHAKKGDRIPPPPGQI